MTRLHGALLLLLAPTVLLAQPANKDDPQPSGTYGGQTYGTMAAPQPAPAPAPAAEPAAPAEPSYEVTARQYETTTMTEEKPSLFKDLGFAITLGGGVSGFTDDTARTTSADGGGWDVRATIGTRKMLAMEVSYLGSAQTIDALGLDSDAMLVGNGVQANARLNFARGYALTPFVFVGAAWRRYDLANFDSNTSDVADSDNVVEFPMGAGVAYRIGDLILDARGEYRPTTDADLMPSLTRSEPGAEASLHRWGVNANIGYEF